MALELLSLIAGAGGLIIGLDVGLRKGLLLTPGFDPKRGLLGLERVPDAG